jgi:hypothetical protein
MPRDGRIYIWSNGLKIAEVIALADFDFDNAKLILAAPDMLRELQDVLDWSRTEREPLGENEMDSIREAIAKATGGAQ